jgi:hypothetical protein
VIEIEDSGRYSETLDIAVAAGGSIEIRAANRRRPVLALDGLTVMGGEDGACILNGLLITGTTLEVPDVPANQLERLRLLDCTLVPGLALTPDGAPTQPATPSLTLGIAGLETTAERCLMGAVRAHDRASFAASDCVIDSTGATGVAYAGPDGEGPGAALSLDACTVVGKVHTAEVGLISNSILFARLADGDAWPVPVRAARKQVGCVRFSWAPWSALLPRRYRCQPATADDAQRIAPRFTSLRYGTPPYARLALSTPVEVLRGADDESEMGVFHHLYGSQRETNLRIRLAEYLRVSLRAGIFYES